MTSLTADLKKNPPQWLERALSKIEQHIDPLAADEVFEYSDSWARLSEILQELAVQIELYIDNAEGDAALVLEAAREAFKLSGITPEPTPEAPPVGSPATKENVLKEVDARTVRRLDGGIHFATDNIYRDGDEVVLGSPYRKEVSITDDLGSFQTTSFKINDDGTLSLGERSHEPYNETVSLGEHLLQDFVDQKLKIQDEFATSKDFFDGLYHEIGLMY